MATAETAPFSGGAGRAKLIAPANACDCHIHIFDDRFPIVPGAPLPPNASVDDYRLVQRRIGTSRAVVVAPSMYGFDNRCTIQTTREFGPRARCVVALEPNVNRSVLADLHASGARGFRFNLARSKLDSIETLKPIAERVAEFGWHVQLWLTAAQLVECEPYIRELPIPIVLDHLARLPQDGGRASPAYEIVRGLLDRGNTWMKLSLATAVRLFGTPEAREMTEMAKTLVATASDRLLWGSDWPHVMALVEGHPIPDDAMLLDLLLEWAPDEPTRHMILVTNPEKVYGFEVTSKPQPVREIAPAR